MEVFYLDQEINGTCFLAKGCRSILFDPGMAYYADSVVKQLKSILDGQAPDAVFLTHSHYDHVGAVPRIRQEWPDIKVYAAEYACHVFEKPKARKMIYDLSVTAAAQSSGFHWDGQYRDDLLYADVSLHDGDIISVGDTAVRCIETIGHTRCSMSFLIDEDIMISSETIGLEGDHGGGYLPSFLVSYKCTVESLQRSKAANPKRIYMPHRGLVEPDERFWNHLESGLEETRHVITDILARYDSPEDQLLQMEDIYWKKTARGAWPREAFDINARAMLHTIAAEFPEEIAEKKSYYSQPIET